MAFFSKTYGATKLLFRFASVTTLSPSVELISKLASFTMTLVIKFRELTRAAVLCMVSTVMVVLV